MPKLTDTQAILLSAASQRADLSVFPLPATLGNAGPRVTRALAALMSAGFAKERETSSAKTISRIDGDVSYGLFATPAGLAAIGVEPIGGEGAAPLIESATATEPRTTKTAAVLALLQRDGGATLLELIAATRWLSFRRLRPSAKTAALCGHDDPRVLH